MTQTLVRTKRPKAPPLLFLRKFLKHGRRVASFAPSSRPLASAMCLHVSATKPQTILELGAGTGAVTVVAASRMHPESRLVALEIDPHFCRVLRQQCPRAEVVCADVSDLPHQLDRLGIDRCDVLLNGLPTPSLPRSLNAVVLRAFQRFSSDSLFCQLTVMPWVYKPTYERLFEEVRFRLVMRNVPPGGIYFCRGLRSNYADHLPGLDRESPPVAPSTDRF